MLAAAGSKQNHVFHQFRMIGRQHARHTITKGMTCNIYRTHIERSDHTGNITGQIMQGNALGITGAFSCSPKVDSDDTVPFLSKE